MLVDYAVKYMGCYDDSSDSAPRDKTMRVNVITTFLLHVAKFITFNKKLVTATLFDKARLKSLYSRLGFKVIKDFATYHHLEKARKQFHYELGKSKELQKQTIGLQFYLTIPRRVTILRGNRIEFNENIDVFKDLNEVPPLDYWFPYEYIDADFNKKLDKIK